MPLWRYRNPKIARHAAFGRMNDYDLENRSSQPAPIKSSSVHDGADRDWNQQTVIVEDALQCSLDRNNNLAVDLP